MWKKSTKIISFAILCTIIISIISIVIYRYNNPINNNIIVEKIDMDNETIKSLETTNTELQNESDEQNLENDGAEEQGTIEYNGSEDNPTIKIGNYKGLIYYSQVDTRWKNHVYTSVGNTKQTIGNSGCGPAVAAMVITATTGAITPPEIGDIFVDYGFRSVNSGTYWSAFSWIADVFNIEYSQTNNVDEAIELVKKENYVVVPCGYGLFTYGGHYILIVGIENDVLQIYDPYLYNGKFETSTRKGKVELNGNTVYCSIENFKKYAKPKNFFAFKGTNQTTNVIEVTNIPEQLAVNKQEEYKVKIIAKSGLRIRQGNGTNYKKIGLYNYGEEVVILSESNGWGKTNYGWICLDYTKKIELSSETDVYNAGTYKVNCSKLNVRTGPGTNYRKKQLYELTLSARKQGGYVKNVVCTVYEVKNNWGRTPSGWICLDYCIKIR